MKTKITTHGLKLTSELADYVNRRVRFSMGRFAGRISRLSIRIADVNGPRGGVDKRCDVVVEAGLAQPIVVHERHASLFAAIGLAVERAQRTLRRRIAVEQPDGRRAAGPRLLFLRGD